MMGLQLKVARGFKMGFAGNNELRSCSPAVGTTYDLTAAEQASLRLVEQGAADMLKASGEEHSETSADV